MIFVIILLVIIIAVAGSCIRIVPQARAYVVEFLGAYKTTWSRGLYFKIPFFERVARNVNLKEQVIDFPPQPVITKDNVTMQIDTVIFFQITDPKLYCYGVENPISAIENLTSTSLRNIIGDMELDETLTSREVINAKMGTSLDEATDPWGIKVNRVEVKNIIPPRDIQEAMEKQMRAERERRESILRAEGEKRSNILTAEGEKEAMVLRANAKKEAMIAEAEGQARAMERIYEAQACGIEMIKNANPTKEYLSLKSLETYEKMADGKATKIVVPSEMQNMASFLTSAREILVDDAAKDALEEVIKPKKG